MDDSQYGIRDRRGYWRPFKPVMNAPIFVWPVQPKVLAKWLFGHDGYMLPWNLFYASIAVFYWFYLTPSIDTMKTLTFDWPIYLLSCNAVILFLLTGSLHLICMFAELKARNSNTMLNGLPKTIQLFSFEIRIPII